MTTLEPTAPQHILPDKCPFCGEVARNDMSVVKDRRTGQRIAGHVQFSCNFEIEIVEGKEPVVIRECRKGKIWPGRKS
jgi:hypothetical protein